VGDFKECLKKLDSLQNRMKNDTIIDGKIEIETTESDNQGTDDNICGTSEE
jgi:hypothetical protein